MESKKVFGLHLDRLLVLKYETSLVQKKLWNNCLKSGSLEVYGDMRTMTCMLRWLAESTTNNSRDSEDRYFISESSRLLYYFSGMFGDCLLVGWLMKS